MGQLQSEKFKLAMYPPLTSALSSPTQLKAIKLCGLDEDSAESEEVKSTLPSH